MTVLVDARSKQSGLGLLSCLLLVSVGVTPALSGEAGVYGRGEAGISILGQDRAFWQSGAGDPRITFSVDQRVSPAGALGVGYDWGNGVRADGSLNLSGVIDVGASFLSASDGTPATGHVTTVSTSVSAISLMGNLFVEPLRLAGHEGDFQPFLTAGLGVARVSMGDWTRLNPVPPARASRTFDGASQTNFAWTVGGGVSLALGNALGVPGFLDLSYRYTNMGNVSGSNNPQPASGAGTPVEAFNLDLVTHTVMVGLRMPFGAN